MKTVLDVTDRMHTGRVVDAIVMFFVKICYNVYMSPMQNFYAVRNIIAYDDAMGIVNHIDKLTAGASEVVYK